MIKAKVVSSPQKQSERMKTTKRLQKLQRAFSEWKTSWEDCLSGRLLAGRKSEELFSSLTINSRLPEKMVVSSVHTLPMNDGLSGPQMVEYYTRQLEALGAKKSGTFSVECECYHSNPAITTANETRVLSLITASEYPASAFSIIEKSSGPSTSSTGTSTTSSSNSCTVVTDSSIEQILTNLSLFYSKKVHIRMEVRGQRWTLNDFVIKLGSCTLGGGNAFKAVVAEIEYGPCCVPGNCWDLIKELGQTFVGASIHQPQTHLMARMNELFYPVDVIHQYNEIFTQLRKGDRTLGNNNSNGTNNNGNSSSISSPSVGQMARA